MTSLYTQQGDLLLFAVDSVKGEVVNTNLVHKGQSHHHRIEGDYKIYMDREDMYIEAIGDCILFHEEHKDCLVPGMGAYKKRIVLEYDHFLEESKEVID